MRNNFHYGFGTRLTAVILTFLMVLSLGGFVLRGAGAGEPEVFPESYGTPVPAETAAPEATEEPAEVTAAPAETTPVPETETPAPEETEAPAEATEVPETDSGTDTNVNTSEPEATADPQMTPAPETEPTAAPEGDTPADGPLMDEPAPIDGGGLKITLKVDRGEIIGNTYNYTLTITRTEGTLSGSAEVQFESKAADGSMGNCQAKAGDVLVDGLDSGYSKSGNGVDITKADFSTVVIKLTADASGSLPNFKIKLKGFYSSNVDLLCTDSGSEAILTYQDPDKTQEGLNFEKGSSSNSSDDRTVTYHLNPPVEGKEDVTYTQTTEDGSYV